jgi:hypothetical protein
MRRLMTATTIAASLVFAASAVASALAVLPTQRSKFSGVTSEHAVNGYKGTVTFVTPAGGRTLKNFVFETLGCFGSGQFPVGVDPFAEMPWRVASIPVETTGVYLAAKVKATSTALDAGTMIATISGSFTSPQKVTGKITFSQDQQGATCGPRTLKFTAAVGTPPSSGP